MVFRTRNSYYLRMSERTVLPLHLYLDERHLDWMNDTVLQFVISDLRPLILPKMREEAAAQDKPGASGKRSTVETHRGETYQFCYFIRNTEPHSLVIKSRQYVTAPPPSRLRAATGKRTGNNKGKRKAPTKGPSTRKKQKKARAPDAMDEDAVISDDDSDMYVEEREDGHSDASEPLNSDDDLAERILIDNEEEEKPKPLLRLNYQGFNISGQCLCVVVEPWPAVKSPAKPPSEKPTLELTSRFFGQSRLTPSAIAAPQAKVSPTPGTRGETPLFLPDDEDLHAAQEQAHHLPPTLPGSSSLYTMDSDNEDDPWSGVMAFSQALNNTGDNRPGAAGEDDEMDGAVLFADADEIKEL